MVKPTSEVAGASVVAAIYAIMGCVYIVFSTSYVATTSITKDELEAFELWKGLGFIAVTSLILFASVIVVFRRLRQRDRLILGTFAAIDDAVVLIDQKTLTVLDCSPSTEIMLGVTRQQLREGGLDLLLSDSAVRETVRTAIIQVAESDTPHHVELPLTTARNELVYARVSLTAFDWRESRVAVLSISDATEDRKARQTLREQAADLTERVKELRGLYGISRQLADVSQPLVERMKAVVGLMPPAWQYPDRTSARIRYDGRVFATDGFRETAWTQSADIVVQNETIGSVEVFVDWDGADPDAPPFLPEEQDLVDEIAHRMSLAIEQDRFNEHQQEALKASQDSERRFHSLSEAVPLPVLVSETHTGQILYANSLARNLMVDGDPGAQETTFYYSDETERAEVLATLKEHGRIAGREMSIRTADGADRRIEVYAETIDFGGTPAIITTFLDVTDKRLAEEAFLHAQKMESVGRLTGGVAHDFNNLLTVIMGNADFLIEEADSPDIRKWAENLKLAAERGATLTQRLLATSRQQTLRPQRFEMNKLLDGMLIFMNRTLGEDVEIETRFDDGLWPVRADAAQVEQAVLNLAINARDAMPSGGSLILSTANVTPQEAAALSLGPRGHVRVSVSDTGVGIAREHVNRVFDPFFTTKEVGKGTGLGLSMVYGFAKQSGGLATIESEPGAGTRVNLYLPRADERDAEEGPTASRSPRAARPGRILVVEDERLVRETVVAQLSRFDHSVVAANNAEGAVEILERDAGFDLLFTDIVMPGGMSGIDLAERARKSNPGLRVIFTTGYSDHAALTRLADMIDARVIQKPYSADELATTIQEALARPGKPVEAQSGAAISEVS